MARKRRLHRRYGKQSSAPRRSNPTLLADLAEFVGPGFAGFAATRLLTRIATVQIAKKKPSWAKHAGAIASLGSFAAAWFGAHRVKVLERYHTPLVVGSAIAAIQTLIQLYIPKIGWMIADASPDIDQSLMVSAPTPQAQLAEANLQPVNDDPDWYTFDDKYDAGIYAKETGSPPPAAGASARKAATEEDILADLNLDDDASMGIFAGN